MLEIVPRADHPPRVLGTIAQNQRWAMTKDFDKQDDQEADPARLAIKRAEAAKNLCEAIQEFCVADVEGSSIAARWAMLTKSAARALDFDARVTPSDTLLKAHEILTSTLRDTTEALVGTNLSEEEHKIVSAPGPLGGCSLRALSSIIADAAFLSSWLCTRKAVQEHAEAMGRPLLHEPNRGEAERARINLQHTGVPVDFDGKIELSNEAKRVRNRRRTFYRVMRNIEKMRRLKDGHTATKKKKNGDGKREAQELVELGAHHWTARSCQTHTGERQNKRGLGASTSHRT